MAHHEPVGFAEVVYRFGQVVAKTINYTLRTQARRSWYFSPTFSSGVDRDEVEELTHEVLMLLPAALQQFRGEAKAETYVATIARNHVMRVLKKRSHEARRRVHIPAHLVADDVPVENWLDNLNSTTHVEQDFTTQIAEAQADAQAVSAFARMSALAGLTAEQAEVVRLRRSGCTDQEIAALQNCNQGTVRKRFFDAKEKLRRVYLADPRWKE